MKRKRSFMFCRQKYKYVRGKDHFSTVEKNIKI